MHAHPGIDIAHAHARHAVVQRPPVFVRRRRRTDLGGQVELVAPITPVSGRSDQLFARPYARAVSMWFDPDI